MEKTFLAEIKNVSAVKTVSNDIEIAVKFVTDDNTVLDLGKLPSDTIVRVTVEQLIPEQYALIELPEIKDGDFGFEL